MRLTSRSELLDSERDDLRLLLERVGEPRAADLLGVSRSSVQRALAGLPMRRATVTAISMRLRVVGDLA